MQSSPCNVRIRLAELLESRLRGRVPGKRHFARICAALAGVPSNQVVVLDFHGVDFVTASWVNGVMVPLFRWAAEDQNNLFPIIGGVKDAWLDDVQLVAKWNHQCYLVANGEADLSVRAKLVGPLDPGQRTTLTAVLDFREVTGAELQRRMPDAGTKATAWNNRLKDLYKKRLLKRRKRGREQVYSPVVDQIELDWQLPAGPAPGEGLGIRADGFPPPSGHVGVTDLC